MCCNRSIRQNCHTRLIRKLFSNRVQYIMRPLATIQTNGPTATSSMHPTLIHPLLSTLSTLTFPTEPTNPRTSIKRFDTLHTLRPRRSHVVTCAEKKRKREGRTRDFFLFFGRFTSADSRIRWKFSAILFSSVSRSTATNGPR